MDIATYIHRKDILQNTLFVINEEGKGYFKEEDKSFTREQFRKKYPLPINFLSFNKKNCDHTKDFLIID